MTSSETDARGHRGDGRWPAGGPARPPLIVAAGRGAAMPGGVKRTGTPVGRGHGSGSSWRGRRGGVGSGCTRRTVRTLGEAREGGGVCGPPARARGRHGFGRGRRCPRVSAGPEGMQHEAEPPESQDRALVGDMGRHHGDAPLPGGVTGTF